MIVRGQGCTSSAAPPLGSRLGVDICEIARMERALARHPTMRDRVFTPEEIRYCAEKLTPADLEQGILEAKCRATKTSKRPIQRSFSFGIAIRNNRPCTVAGI